MIDMLVSRILLAILFCINIIIRCTTLIFLKKCDEMFTVLYLETKFYLELFRIVFIVHNVGILTK